MSRDWTSSWLSASKGWHRVRRLGDNFGSLHRRKGSRSCRPCPYAMQPQLSSHQPLIVPIESNSVPAERRVSESRRQATSCAYLRSTLLARCPRVFALDLKFSSAELCSRTAECCRTVRVARPECHARAVCEQMEPFARFTRDAHFRPDFVRQLARLFRTQLSAVIRCQLCNF